MTQRAPRSRTGRSEQLHTEELRIRREVPRREVPTREIPRREMPVREVSRQEAVHREMNQKPAKQQTETFVKAEFATPYRPAPVQTKRPQPAAEERPARQQTYASRQKKQPAQRRTRPVTAETQPVQRQKRPASETSQRQKKEASEARKAEGKPVQRARKPEKKKVFTKKFKKIFFISWGAFALVLVGLLAFLWVRMASYEKGLPEHCMNQVLEEVKKGDLSQLHLYASDGSALADGTVFADITKIGEVLSADSQAQPLRYVKINAESTDETMAYAIRSDEEKLLKVQIEKNSDGEWKEVRTDLIGKEFAVQTLTVQIPSAERLQIDGQEISESFRTEQGGQIKLLSNLINRGIINDQPTVDTYQVRGIFAQPKVAAVASDGSTQECVLTGDVYTAGFAADEAFVNEQKQRVFDIFEPYALYFTGDASRGSLREIMLDDSPAYENAAATDVSWMQEHDRVELSNQSAENFRKYSDECYSCDIHFTETIYQWGEPVRTWDTNMTWIMVKSGDQYYLADFVAKNADES